jgi:hypothetical protein
MDVAHPYAAFAPTLDGPVLEALARTTKPLTGRAIDRLVRRGSHRGVRLALERLVAQGLVTVEEAGRAHLYVLNRDHVAAPAVELLMGLRAEVVRRIRGAIAAWAVQPAHASLFGSMARGDGDVESDIDILVIRPSEVDGEDPRWEHQVYELGLSVERWTGNRATLMELSVDDLRDRAAVSESLFDDIRRDAVELGGAAIDVVLPRRKHP